MPAPRPQDDIDGVIGRFAQALADSRLSQPEVAHAAANHCSLTVEAMRPVVRKAAKFGAVPRKSEVRNAVATALGVDPSWLWFGVAGRAPSMVGPAAARQLDDLDAAPSLAEISGPQAVAPVPQAPQTANAAPAAVVAVPSARPDPAGYVVVVNAENAEHFAPYAGGGDAVWVSPSYAPRAGDLVYIAAGGLGRLFRYLGADADGVLLASPGGVPVRRQRGEIHKVGAVIYG
ncbi:MAG TPA: hypothetical protein VD860_08635 [Azospirillum sp.]|nr:hypothetical protein [Azospirillum sp.]